MVRLVGGETLARLHKSCLKTEKQERREALHSPDPFCYLDQQMSNNSTQPLLSTRDLIRDRMGLMKTFSSPALGLLQIFMGTSRKQTPSA